MKAVITCYSDNMQEVADLTIPTQKAYADSIWATYEARVVPSEDAVWTKIDMVREFLASPEKHDAVIWMDADLAITNPEADSLFGIGSEITLSADINGLNAGIFFARNTPEVRRYFHAVGTHGKTLFGDKVTGEQLAMQHFASHFPYGGIIAYVAQEHMNAYWPGAYEQPDSEDSPWKPGCFALHLPGMPNERRVEIFREIGLLPR